MPDQRAEEIIAGLGRSASRDRTQGVVLEQAALQKVPPRVQLDEVAREHPQDTGGYEEEIANYPVKPSCALSDLSRSLWPLHRLVYSMSMAFLPGILPVGAPLPAAQPSTLASELYTLSVIEKSLASLDGTACTERYNGYWFWGRPSVEEFRQDLRAVTQKIRPDWDLATPGLRENWDGDKRLHYPYKQRTAEQA